MFLFLSRTLRFAFQGFFRNFWLSVVTIVILVLTIFSITVVAGINVIAKQAIVSIQDRVDVSVYFKPDTSENDALAVRDQLLILSEVESVVYISKDDALGTFKEKHSDDPVILQSIEQLEDNPLSATIVIKAYSIDEYASILTILDAPEYAELIEDRNFDDNEVVITRLSEVSSSIQRVGIIISTIFILIAILIILNTIRINIYTHREEIGIMKLVGSSDAFVRAPFIFESFIYAILAVIVSIAVLYPLVGFVSPQVNSFFEGYDLDLLEYVNDNLIRIILWQFIFAVVLSVVSSVLAIRRYLRV